MSLQACRCSYDGLGAAPIQASASFEALLSTSGDLKDAASIKGLLSQLPKGVNPQQLLSQAGVPNVGQLLSQAGLPPEIGSLVGVSAAILGKGGFNTKANAVLGLAQGLLSQTQGPVLGTISGKLGATLSKALGIENVAGKVGAVTGSAAGSALFGPIGGTVGQVVGGLVGGTVGKILPKGAKAQRNKDERGRVKGDQQRIAAFRYQKPEDVYAAFRAGKVFWTEGVPGTKKWSEKQSYTIRNGKVTDVSAEMQAGRLGWPGGKELLFMDSVSAPQAFLATMFNVEQKIVKQTQEDARAARQRIMQVLAQAAVRQPLQPTQLRITAAVAPRPVTAPKPAGRTEAQRAKTRKKKAARMSADKQASATAAAVSERVAPAEAVAEASTTGPSYEQLVQRFFG